MIDLQKYCSKKSLLGLALNTPFSNAEHTYATNGHVFIRVPKIASIENDEMYSFDKAIASLEKYIVGFEGLVFHPIGDLPPLAYKSCDTCDGVGQVHAEKECMECRGFGEVKFSNSYNDYEIECKSCEGSCVVEDTSKLVPCSTCEGQKQVLDSELNRMTFTNNGASSDVDSAYVREFADLPNAVCAVVGKGLAIKFDGGSGFILGMKGKVAS